MGNIKATSILDCRRYISKNFEPEQDQKIQAALDETDRSIIYSPKLLPVSWVNVGVAVRYMLTLDKILGQGDGKTSEKIVREIAQQHFKGIYKIFFLVMSPKAVIHQMPQLWKQYYDTGRDLVVSVGANQAVTQLVEFPDIPLHHERLIIPYVIEIMTQTGAKNFSIKHTRCIARGDRCCETEYHWE